MNILDITNGHIKELFNLNKELSDSRMKICYICPLFLNKFGGICNNRLWLNVDTGDISVNKKEGYKNGCGCRLLSKTRLPNAECPLKKW